MLRAVLCACLAVAVTTTARADNYLLVAKSGTVADTKANGWAWDIFCGHPDPYVKVWVYDAATAKQVDYGETAFVRDTHTPVWNKEVAQVQKGDRIKIEVWDKDLIFDDLIGSCEFMLDAADIQRGYVLLKFGQMEELRLELR